MSLNVEGAMDISDTSDLPECIALLNHLNTEANELSQSIKELHERVNNGDFVSTQGISLLEVKNNLLLSYITNVTYIIYRKLSGGSLKDEESVVDFLTEIRTVLEKIRPIDHKLKYQIDKLVKTANTGKLNEHDPLRYKPNPGNMVNKLDEMGDSDEDADEGNEERLPKKNKSNTYVPPKLSAVHYDGDESVADKRQKLLDRARKRALSSNIMQELRREYDEGPEEVRESRNIHRIRDDHKVQERTEYEEEYMTRLTLTKQEKHKNRHLTTMSNLSEIARFEDISALDVGGANEFGGKKKKSGKKHVKKSKKGFRKRKWK